MAGRDWAALASILGTAAGGIPKGLEAGDQERQRQQSLDQTQAYRDTSLGLQRDQFAETRRQHERANAPVDLSPYGGSTTQDPRTQNAAMQYIFKERERAAAAAKEAEGRQRVGQMADAVADANAQRGPVPESFGDVGATMDPVPMVRDPNMAALAKILRFMPAAQAATTAAEQFKPRPPERPIVAPLGSDVLDVSGRVLRPGQEAPAKPTEGDARRAEIHNYLVNVRRLTPGTPQYETEFMDWRNRPITIFPGGGAFQMTDVVRDRPDGTPPQPVVSRPPTPPSVSAEQTASFADFRSLLGNMNRVEKLYDARYVGPVAGRLGAVRGKTGIGATQPEASLRTALAQVQNSVIYLKSGKQINEQEYVRLARELPDPSDPEPVFKAKLAASKSLMQEMLANREAEFRARGYRGSGPDGPVSPDAPNAAGGGRVGPDAQRAGTWKLREISTGRVRPYQPDPGETQPPAGYEHAEPRRGL